MAEELPDDATLTLEMLFDIRANTERILDLLLEEDDGEEEPGNA